MRKSTLGTRKQTLPKTVNQTRKPAKAEARAPMATERAEDPARTEALAVPGLALEMVGLVKVAVEAMEAMTACTTIAMVLNRMTNLRFRRYRDRFALKRLQQREQHVLILVHLLAVPVLFILLSAVTVLRFALIAVRYTGVNRTAHGY